MVEVFILYGKVYKLEPPWYRMKKSDIKTYKYSKAKAAQLKKQGYNVIKVEGDKICVENAKRLIILNEIIGG